MQHDKAAGYSRLVAVLEHVVDFPGNVAIQRAMCHLEGGIQVCSGVSDLVYGIEAKEYKLRSVWLLLVGLPSMRAGDERAR